MTTQIVIPTNPKDIQRIKSAVLEGADCLTRIDAEKDQLKSIVDMIKDELDIPKSVFKKMVTAYHKQNIEKITVDVEDLTELYETVMK